VILSVRTEAWLELMGKVCDALGGLYLAFDIFKRHSGPLGVLTRAATYSVVLAAVSTPALGPSFGAIMGLGLGMLISFEFWRLARIQRLQRRSPLRQTTLAGVIRGAILGLAAMPRFGWRFGAVMALVSAACLALVYGQGFVPTFRPEKDRLFYVPKASLRASLLRALAMAAGGVAAAALVPGRGGALAFGAEIGGLVFLSSLAIGLIAPWVEWRTESASDAFFVGAGLLLLFCGLTLDTIPQAAVLLSGKR